MNTQMKGSFSRWSSRSAQWYEEASQYTNYHNELTKHIAPYLSSRERCCELACGTGTLARHLAPLTAHYTANDIDPESIDFCKKVQEQNPVRNLEFAEGDWHTVLKGQTFEMCIRDRDVFPVSASFVQPNSRMPRGIQEASADR